MSLYSNRTLSGSCEYEMVMDLGPVGAAVAACVAALVGACVAGAEVAGAEVAAGG